MRMTAPGVAVTGARRWVTLAVLCVTLLLISLDNTILNVALPSIVRGLHATSTQLQWIVDAFAIFFAGLLLSFGALGDRVGRKWVFMGGLVVFGGGSALAAWSGTPDRLIGARAIMGVGAAALMPSTLSILTNVFTADRERARAIGIWSGNGWAGGGHRADVGGLSLGPLLVGLGVPHQRPRRPDRPRSHRFSRPQFEEPPGQAGRSAGRGPVDRGHRIVALGDHRGAQPHLDLSAHRRSSGGFARHPHPLRRVGTTQ